MSTEKMRSIIDMVKQWDSDLAEAKSEEEIDEKAQTIASATGKGGMINRRKAKAAVDPHDYFKGEKSAYQNVK